MPIPELTVVHDVSSVLAAFAAAGPPAADPTATPPTATPPTAGPDPAAPPVVPVDPDPSPVSDEDRTRYGLLLDRAAERGLLSTGEYELRLGELATATSVEELRRIVTDLPALTAPPAPASARRGRRATRVDPTVPPVLTPGESRKSPWLLLALVVVVVLVTLTAFSFYAEHVVRSRSSGTPAPAVATRPVSALRS
jgi:hypothetical protein